MATTTHERRSTSGGPTRTGGATSMWLAVVGLGGIALTHLLELPAKLEASPLWESIAFLLVAIVALTLIVPLLRAADRSVYLAAGAVAGMTLLAYVVSRMAGLPGDAGTVGEWYEPLGVLSVLSEVAVIAGTALAVRVRR